LSRTHERPLSPHLTIWKWGPHMLVSILHRITGSALTIAGLALLTWWLLAIAGDGDGYARFVAAARHPLGLVVLVGLTWAFWQHFFSGLRHLTLDIGAGYELRINRLFSVLAIAGALFATALTWFVIMGVGR
jgi:succinate dehydrogenase / fumarate reductase cytochrome b subunit